MAPNINGTSQKWHLAIYIVVTSPGLALYKLRGHCNIEVGTKGYFSKKFQYILSIIVYRKGNRRDYIVH